MSFRPRSVVRVTFSTSWNPTLRFSLGPDLRPTFNAMLRGLDPDLLWILDGTDTRTATDLSGNGRHGEIVGGPFGAAPPLVRGEGRSLRMFTALRPGMDVRCLGWVRSAPEVWGTIPGATIVCMARVDNLPVRADWEVTCFYFGETVQEQALVCGFVPSSVETSSRTILGVIRRDNSLNFHTHGRLGASVSDGGTSSGGYGRALFLAGVTDPGSSRFLVDDYVSPTFAGYSFAGQPTLSPSGSFTVGAWARERMVNGEHAGPYGMRGAVQHVAFFTRRLSDDVLGQLRQAVVDPPTGKSAGAEATYRGAPQQWAVGAAVHPWPYESFTLLSAFTASMQPTGTSEMAIVAASAGIRMAVRSGSVRASEISNGGSALTTAASFDIRQPIRAAFVHQAAGVTTPAYRALFLNGRLVNSSTTIGSWSQSSLGVGYSPGGGDVFSGSIGEVTLLNAALPALEAQRWTSP